MLKEIISEFRKVFLSKKVIKIFGFSAGVILLFCLYLWITSPKANVENIEPLWSNSTSDISAFKDGDISKLALTDEESYSSVEAAISLFFSYAQHRETDLFASAVNYEQFQSDFFQYDVTERHGKIEEALNRISRNGQLEGISVVKSGWALEPDTVRLVVDLKYKDLNEPVRISVLVAGEDEYEAETDETTKVYYVVSSVWEVIRNIEGKV